MGLAMVKRVGLALRVSDNGAQDLSIDASGDLELVYDAEAVGQHTRQRLQTHVGEWFLDTSVGVPWLKQILGKGYDPALADAVTKACILGTDGVTEITTFSVSFALASRGLVIKSVNVLTDYDKEVRI